jgi:hypothetical protein
VLAKEKTWYFRIGFFFVHQRLEISNLELIKDMERIINIGEVL